MITAGNSANSESEDAIVRLRNRSRDLVRNNPYAKRGVHGIANNVVGRGIMTQIKLDNDKSISEAEKTLNGVWKAWSRTVACDFEGRQNLVSMQRLIMKSIVESGEVLVRYRRDGIRVVEFDGIDYSIPAFSLQILDSDFLQF